MLAINKGWYEWRYPVFQGIDDKYGYKDWKCHLKFFTYFDWAMKANVHMPNID